MANCNDWCSAVNVSVPIFYCAVTHVVISHQSYSNGHTAILGLIDTNIRATMRTSILGEMGIFGIVFVLASIVPIGCYITFYCVFNLVHFLQ